MAMTYHGKRLTLATEINFFFSDDVLLTQRHITVTINKFMCVLNFINVRPGLFCHIVMKKPIFEKGSEWLNTDDPSSLEFSIG